MAKRMPAQAEQSLHMGNIFIFPSKFGWVFIGFIFLLFLLGTNYQNNLVLILSYLMISLFITAIFQSFINLLGLELKAKQINKGFVGENIQLSLTARASLSKHAIYVYCPNLSEKTYISNVIPNENNVLEISLPLTKRGIFPVGRLTVESFFAFGLLRTWSKLDFGWKVLAIPSPRKYLGQQPVDLSGETSDLRQSEVKGNDDFHQLKSYQQGEPLTHVSWKHMARGQGMLTKEYRAELGNTLWLSLKSIQLSNIEEKLQVLVYCVLELANSGQQFGLELAGKRVLPGNSEQHINQCLELIACYEK